PDGIEVAGGLDAGKAVQVRAGRGGRGEFWRDDAGIPGARESEQARGVRSDHRPSGTAACQQQRERRRELHRVGLQQINVRAVGLIANVQDIEDTVLKAQNGVALHVRDIATVTQGPRIRLGQIGKALRRDDGKIIDNEDVVEGIVLLRKGSNADAVIEDIHAKVKELNERILPPGVQIVPFLDRSDLVHLTTHTVLHNLTAGVLLVSLILFFFLGNARGALIVALTIPFSLLFASICLDLNKIPANLLSLGALDFGMVVDGSVVVIENIVRHYNLAAN